MSSLARKVACSWDARILCGCFIIKETEEAWKLPEKWGREVLKNYHTFAVKLLVCIVSGPYKRPRECF